jgi:hypothetical protein
VRATPSPDAKKQLSYGPDRLHHSRSGFFVSQVEERAAAQGGSGASIRISAGVYSAQLEAAVRDCRQIRGLMSDIC